MQEDSVHSMQHQQQQQQQLCPSHAMSPSRSRWSPTREQLMVLEELYRRGLTNPKASQIQNIAAHLAVYGRIQAKNVFYWFQNRKARDRQRLRSKIVGQLHQPQLIQLHQNVFSVLDFPAPSVLHRSFSSEFLHLQHHHHLPPPPIPPPPSQGGERARSDSPARNRDIGGDAIKIMEIGSYGRSSRVSPPETLELFPLRSPSKAKDQQQQQPPPTPTAAATI